MGTVSNAYQVSQWLWGRRASDAAGSTRPAHGNILPFIPRQPISRLPALNATLIRHDTVRRYVVRRGRGPTEWFCEVWLGRTRLRGIATENMTEVVRYVDECRCEIDALLE